MLPLLCRCFAILRRSFAILCQALAVLAVQSASVLAAPESAPSSVSAGKLLAEDNRCTECHGLDGNGQNNSAGALGIFPKLAGQDATYLFKQFLEFRRDLRHSDIMAIMAKSVDDADAKVIIAYYSSLPRMQGAGAKADPSSEKLLSQGDMTRGILPCFSCHGANGKGLATPIGAIIGGQDKAYLQKELQNWRSGERKNSADGVMNAVAKRLTDAEINNLADYLSGL